MSDMNAMDSTAQMSLADQVGGNHAADSTRSELMDTTGTVAVALTETEQYQPVQARSAARPVRAINRLYVSHFLSTWNSRLYEMGAVLFVAAVYPGTLRPISIYALLRNTAAIVFAPAVGSWIDRGNRLDIIRLSIIGQRLAVALSCGIFWIMLAKRNMAGEIRTILFSVTIILACIEKLSSVMNLVSVERDWVVVICHDDDTTRRKVNARLRRIDLFCKLFGPLVITLINGASTLAAVWTTFAMSCVSIPVEYSAIAAVYRTYPALQRVQGPGSNTRNRPSVLGRATSTNLRLRISKFCNSVRSNAVQMFALKSLPYYCHHQVFLPSMALSLLYLTVLSFSGQMITFLLGVGYTSWEVAIARTISAVFEISATWIAPQIQRGIGVVRGGLWFLIWQTLWLAAGTCWFFTSSETTPPHKILAASGLVGTVILSRIGLWGFDLCVQGIVQEEVIEENRGAFSTVEASFQNLFELFSYMTTIIFFKVDQFRWPVVISIVAVYVAAGLYAAYVRRERGHLVHMPKC